MGMCSLYGLAQGKLSLQQGNGQTCSFVFTGKGVHFMV